MHSRYSDIDVRPRLTDSALSAHELRLDPSEKGTARQVRAGRTSRHVAPALVINRMYHVYDTMGPPGRRIARHVRDSSIPLTVDGTARRVPGKGPGTGSGRVERRASVLPGFEYFVSIHTVPPVPRGPVGKV